MMINQVRPVATAGALAGLVALVGALAACSSSGTPSSSASTPTVTVAASDTGCVINPNTLPAGEAKFAVTNSGSQVTEVYIYGRNGNSFTTVVSEVENIGPGTSRDMTANLSAGSYEVACKPGQTGSGIRATLTVTGSASNSISPTGSTPAAAAREIELSTNGAAIAGLTGQSARVGEVIEFKLTNKATGPRVLEIKRPDGSVAGEVDVAAGKVGELKVSLGVAGQWRVILEGGTTELETPLPVTA